MTNVMSLPAAKRKKSQQKQVKRAAYWAMDRRRVTHLADDDAHLVDLADLREERADELVRHRWVEVADVAESLNL